MDPELPVKPTPLKRPVPFFLTLLVLLLLLSTSYLTYQNMQLKKLIADLRTQTTPTPPTTPTPDPTANWKTYSNSTLGYSLNYPPDFVIEKSTDRDIAIVRPGVPRGGQGNSQPASALSILDRGSEGFLANPEVAAIRESRGVQEAMLNGYQILRIKPVGNDRDNKYIDDFYIADNNGKQVIRIYIYSFADTGYEKTMFETFTQILSTFKFLDTYTCPASGWVDCMPGPEAKPQCSETAMSWYKVNCPNFQGGAL